ncbi:unnamed protein product [Orchesella dallaii]|uniref:Uncharacterized protein n=1 Tax=Orchesella dallaii TaxID=48710 RepID=A0ABP1RJ40_9HEXA
MKTIFIVLAICAVALANTATDDDQTDREGRYVLLESSGRVFDRRLNNVVSDIVVDSNSYRSTYSISAPLARSNFWYY